MHIGICVINMIPLNRFDIHLDINNLYGGAMCINLSDGVRIGGYS